MPALSLSSYFEMGKHKIKDGQDKNPLEGLAAAWDNDPNIRNAIRHRGTTLRWPNEKTVGICSQSALGLNALLILEAAKVWCPQKASPKTLPVFWVKHEAWQVIQLLSFGLDFRR